jgi:hypothetical protein
MGKVRRLVALFRKKETLLSLAASFAAILGVVSAILSITGTQFHVGIALLVLVSLLAVAIAFHLRGFVSPQVTVDDVLYSDNLDALFTKLHCPCDLALSNQAKELAQQCYVSGATIAADVYEQLRVKNPFILSCLTDRSGSFLGYFDAIPLRQSFAEAFLRGTVTEAAITHEDVLPPEKMRQCKHLFIAGLAVANPSSYPGRRNANILVWALFRYLAHFYGETKPLCFAVAATKEGDHLLQRFKVALRSEATTRADRYRLYCLELTREEIGRRLAYLPDWQLLCALDWRKPHKQVGRRNAVRRPALSNTKLSRVDRASSLYGNVAEPGPN